MRLPPEDQPDTIDVGPIKGIPIQYDDDPRLHDEREQWSRASREAQAMHSADDLLAGFASADWRVRYEVVDRLIARASDDPRTLPALLNAALEDSVWQVRDAVVRRLHRFDKTAVLSTVQAALADANEDVRKSAVRVIRQLDDSRP
jgi:HEAT repeat protein